MIQDAFVRQRARQLYWQGYPPAEISRLMGINPNTIYAWKKRDQWDETPPVQRVTQSIDARLIQLTEKQNKTGGDFKEIDLLTRQLKKLHDGQPDVMAAGKKGRAKKLKNHFTPEQIAALREKIISRLEWHQRGWFDSLTLCREAGIRNRMILKSRQIGATWYFAQEALLMALRDDVAQPYQRNQIFLSASRRQAFQFKSIIQKAAAEVDVELKGGDKIILSNGAELHFLGTSAASAQSYTGNFYFDEFFWVSRFAELRKVAGAMATRCQPASVSAIQTFEYFAQGSACIAFRLPALFAFPAIGFLFFAKEGEVANKRIAQIGRQQAQRGHGFIHRAACLFSGVSCQCDGFVLFFLCVQAFINQVAQRRGGERRISHFLAALVLCPVGIQPGGKRGFRSGDPRSFTPHCVARLLPVPDVLCRHSDLLRHAIQGVAADCSQPLNFQHGVFCVGMAMCDADAVGNHIDD